MNLEIQLDNFEISQLGVNLMREESCIYTHTYTQKTEMFSMKIITKKTNETTVVSSRTPGDFDQSRGGEEMKTDRQTDRQERWDWVD